jgi:hypothetical protein
LPYRARRGARQSDEFVDGDGGRAEQLFDEFAGVGLGLDWGWLKIVGGMTAGDAARDRGQRFHHVGGVLDQRGALADQAVATLRARVERRTRHRHHFATGLTGEPRRDQRARARGGLDNHRSGGEAGNDAVAIGGSGARARFSAGGHLRDKEPALANRFLPRGILGRVDHVDSTGHDRDRSAVERTVVGGAVDPPRQSGHDGRAFASEVVGEAACEAARRRRGVPRADDRDHRPLEQRAIALDGDQRWGVFKLAERARISPCPIDK